MANEQTSVPLFVADTILTAAQQNISAGTGVPVFATTVTRDAAFGGANKALAEGQLCYLSATNVVQQYNGASWETVGPAAASAVAQVKGAVLTAPSTVAVSTTVFSDTGLTISFTPTSASNKVLVTGQISLGHPYNGACMYQLMRDATAIGVGDVSGSRSQATGSFVGGNNTNDDPPATTQTFSFLDSPATTSAVTYKIQGTTIFAGTTLYINRGVTNTNSASYPTVMSSIICMEVTP